MSDPHTHDAPDAHGEHGHARFPQEEDVLPTVQVSGVLVVLCVLIIGCCIWAFLLMRHAETKLASGPEPFPAAAQPATGRKTGVDQTLFGDGKSFSERFLSVQREKLSSYGWVDQPKGLVHIPIEQAMKEVVTTEGAR